MLIDIQTFQSIKIYAPSGGSKSSISCTQPLSVVAAEIPSGDDNTADIAETKSEAALERSRVAFKQGDYLAASKSVYEALAYTPSDVTLHEFRALVIFALGKYSDAAGVLNSTLASGPGWSWDTMIGFYNGSEAYNEHLANLETNVKRSPEKADAHFLLGYHYMVCGHMEKSNQQFAKATDHSARLETRAAPLSTKENPRKKILDETWNAPKMMAIK